MCSFLILLATLGGAVGGISRRHGRDVGNVLRRGTVVLGGQSDADAVFLLGLDLLQFGPGGQVFDAPGRVGVGGQVLERRAALGGPSKQLGGALEAAADGQEFVARVAERAGLVVGQLPQSWNDSGVGCFGESNGG